MWHVWEGRAIVVEIVEATFKAIIQNANKRVVTEAYRVIALFLEKLRERGNVFGKGVVGLERLVGGWVETGEHRGVGRDRPLAGCDGPVKYGGFLRKLLQNRSRIAMIAIN